MSRRQRIDRAGVYAELFSTGEAGAAPVSLLDILGRGDDDISVSESRAPRNYTLVELEAAYEHERERAIEARLNSPGSSLAPTAPPLGVGSSGGDVPFQAPAMLESIAQVAPMLEQTLITVAPGVREFLTFMLAHRPRAFLTESASRTDSRQSVGMFEQQSRCYVGTTSPRWDDILTRWAGARVRHTTPEDSASPPLVETFTGDGVAYTIRVYNLDSAFFAVCVFERDTYLGAFYVQSEASHQLDIAVVSSHSATAPPNTTAGSM